MKKIPLPIDEMTAELTDALTRHRNLVIVAEPGAGKTTRFPPLLQEYLGPNKKIAILEPRRVAARAAASRVADETEGFHLGRQVGYSVRFDRNLSPETSIIFFTEGLFLQQMKADPKLREFSAVILDEFHERSRHTDLAIGLLMELQSLEREDLRIIAMSATMNAVQVSRFLSDPNTGEPAPIVEVPGRTHPVEIFHEKEPLSLLTDRNWVDRVVRLSSDVYFKRRKAIGDILVFLPGVGEIRRVRAGLDSIHVPTNELHGQLTLDQQTAVLKSSSAVLAQNPSRVILATNIAETSLTIDGVGTVIDTGLARVSRLDRLGFPQLQLERISKANAKQRAGRAGRQFPGLNYRLWSRLDENSFPDFIEPELSRVELSEVLFELIGITGVDPRRFTWFEPPPESSTDKGLELLQRLGAITSDLKTTSLGTKMLETHLSPRLARIFCDKDSPLPLRALLVTLLQEKDFLSPDESSSSLEDCDLHLRASVLFQDAVHTGGLIDRSALQLQKKVLKSLTPIDPTSNDWDALNVERLLLQSFPDRICRRRENGSTKARMVGGRGIELGRNSQVRRSEFFVALRGEAGVSRSTRDPIATLSSPLSRDSIASVFAKDCVKRSSLLFDESSHTVYRETGLMYLDLPLERGHREKASSDEAYPILLEWAQGALEKMESLGTFPNVLERLRWIRVVAPDAPAALTEEEYNECLLKALEDALYGRSNIGDLDLTEFFIQKAEDKTPGFSKSLLALAPTHFTAPTGNRFLITYQSDGSAAVEVRLQELFGLRTHPQVAGGSVPLILKLLGPNFRPVQITSDIIGFWKGSYFAVRKELRARYPKHSWPENPEHAPPEAKGRRPNRK